MTCGRSGVENDSWSFAMASSARTQAVDLQVQPRKQPANKDLHSSHGISTASAPTNSASGIHPPISVSSTSSASRRPAAQTFSSTHLQNTASTSSPPIRTVKHYRESSSPFDSHLPTTPPCGQPQKVQSGSKSTGDLQDNRPSTSPQSTSPQLDQFS
jgi:hypothetical protein